MKDNFWLPLATTLTDDGFRDREDGARLSIDFRNFEKLRRLDLLSPLNACILRSCEGELVPGKVFWEIVKIQEIFGLKKVDLLNNE